MVCRRSGARHLLGLAAQRVADRRPDGVGPVRERALVDQQVDSTEIDIAESDGDLLAVGTALPRLTEQWPLGSGRAKNR